MTNPEHRQQLADLTRQGQEAVAAATTMWADSMKQLTSAMPQMGGQPPDVAQLVDNTFAFARQLLDTQQEVTRALIGALSPGGGNVVGAAAESAARFTDNLTAGALRASEGVAQTMRTAAGGASEVAASTARAGKDAVDSAADAATDAADPTADPAADTAAAVAPDSKSEFADNLTAGTRARKGPASGGKPRR